MTVTGAWLRTKLRTQLLRGACGLAVMVLTLPVDAGDAKRVPRQAADLLPGQTLLYAEIAAPDALIGVLLEHPQRQRVEQLEFWKRVTQSPQYTQFQIGVKAIEFALGMEWRQVVEILAGGGVSLALEPGSNGLAVLARSPDEQQLIGLVDRLVRLIQDDAQRNRRPSPIQRKEYRAVTAYEVSGGGFVVLGPWLVFVNKGDLAKQVIDRFLDGKPAEGDDKGSLADNPRFAAARTAAKPVSVWAFADVDAARRSGLVPQVYGGQSENIVAEFLLGGVLDTLKQSPFVSGGLEVTSTDVRLGVEMPHQRDWVSSAREHYFGPGGAGRAPAAVEVPETLISVSMYRDLSRLWRRADEVLLPRAADELTQANSGLSTLFGGKDFGEEVLGTVGPQIQLIAARPAPEAGYPRPAVRLPGFALVFEMREPEISRREWRRTFQSVIGFLNIVGAMDGQPQLELDIEKGESAELVTSTYLPEEGRDIEGTARINFNFSPTAAFAGKRFVLSSTRSLARQLATAPQPVPDDVPERVVNTRAQLDARILQTILQDNRDQLIARNMLEEGRTRDESTLWIDGLLEVVGFFRRAALQLVTETNSLRLELKLTTVAEEASVP